MNVVLIYLAWMNLNNARLKKVPINCPQFFLKKNILFSFIFIDIFEG